jgi:SAM-dependent methyltransferase
VPDLRLEPDRFLSLEEDRAKGLAVLERSAGRGYRAALDAYWSLTPELAPKLVRGHLLRQLAERQAGEGLLREIERRCGALQAPMLDAGCGLGGLIAAATLRGLPAVGIDAAFRWTLVAKLFLEEARAEALLLCANAEYPPFQPRGFGVAIANDLVEHTRDAPAAIMGVGRMVKPGGNLYVASTHRYSFAPEPHVRLFGVGWLPRSRQSSYVEFRRGHPYDRVRPVSAAELHAGVRASGFEPGRPFAAPVFANHLSGIQRAALRLLEAAPWGSPRIGVVGR